MQAVDVTCITYRAPGSLWARPRALLSDVSLAIEPGAAVALIGANGAGKTTLFKTLLGLIRPHRGEARLFGRPASCPQARRDVGFMPEQPPFAPSATAGEIMRHHACLAGLPRQQACEQVGHHLKIVGLDHAVEARVHTFSKGMQQRLALAQALLGRPRLLLLDEPMSGLDPEGRILMRDVLLAERARSTTLLFSSHTPSDVELLADDVVLMQAGRIVRRGTPQEVFATDASDVEIVAGGSIDAHMLATRLPRCTVTAGPRHVICRARSARDADGAIDVIRQSGGRVVQVAPRPARCDAAQKS